MPEHMFGRSFVDMQIERCRIFVPYCTRTHTNISFECEICLTRSLARSLFGFCARSIWMRLLRRVELNWNGTECIVMLVVRYAPLLYPPFTMPYITYNINICISYFPSVQYFMTMLMMMMMVLEKLFHLHAFNHIHHTYTHSSTYFQNK